MSKDDDKKRHRPNDEKSTYPYNQVTQTAGGHEIHLNSTPDEESYRFFHPAGTSTIVNKDGKKTTLSADHEYHTSANGATRSIEAAYDKLIGGGSRNTDWNGQHNEVAQDLSHGVYGNYIKAIRGNMFRYSTGPTEHCSEGGHFNDHNDGDDHNHSKGDRVWSAGGNYYGTVAGESGHYAQGNWDTQSDKQVRLASKQAMKVQSNSTISTSSDSDTSMVSKAKFSISSEKDMTLTSKAKYELNADQKITIKGKADIEISTDTKIKIKVGGSSIEISSSGIKIDASGEIEIKGSSTKIQGGGLTAPPTTFN